MVVCARWVGEPEGWVGPVLSAPGGVTGRAGALGCVSSTVSPPSLLAPLRLPPLLRQACRPCSRCPRSASLQALRGGLCSLGPLLSPARVWPHFSGVWVCPDGQAPAVSPPPLAQPLGAA